MSKYLRPFAVRREWPHGCGVYEIRHVRTGRVYVGSTTDLSGRLSNHFALLRRGKHWNSDMQAASDLDGEESLVVSVLCLCEARYLTAKEQEWLDNRRALPTGVFNRSPSATNHALALLGRRPAEESIRKTAAALRGRKRSDAFREMCRRRSTGKRHTEEAKAKCSAAKARRWLLRAPAGNDVEVVNLRRFCVENDLQPSSMSLVMRGLQSAHKGWGRGGDAHGNA